MEELIVEIIKIKNILVSLKNSFFYIKDKECRCVYMTESGEKFIGISFSKLIYETSILNDDILIEKQILNGTLENSLNVVYMTRPSDGIKVYMRIEKIPLKSRELIVGLLCIVHDVTENYSNKILLINFLFRKFTPSEKIYFYLITNDFSRKEIAELMDTTLGSVDQIKYRILEKLKLTHEEFEQLKEINFTILNEISLKNF